MGEPDKVVRGGLALRVAPQWWQCPFCLRQVGLVGRGLSFLFGTGFHGCDFRNVMHPQEYAYWKAGRAALASTHKEPTP